MAENKFFDNLKNKEISESSLKLYLNNLRRLNGGEFPTSFKFLKDVNSVLEKIKDFKPNTRRTYLISIVTLLKEEPKQKKLYNEYFKLLMDYNKEMAVNNTKSETQKENWIDQDQVSETYKALGDEVAPLLEKKKLTAPEYEKLLSWVVLSLYTTQKPRRNLDYQHAVIVNKYSDDLDKKFNYLDLPNKMWHFNNYKTKGTYKTQVVEASPEMMEVVTKYLKFHPFKADIKKKSCFVPFLVDQTGEPFENNNAITRILNKIFKKRIGVSMLRNIFLTDKYSDKVEELKKDAAEMGTSAATIQNQYVKLDE
jgi:integrase